MGVAYKSKFSHISKNDEGFQDYVIASNLKTIGVVFYRRPRQIPI